MSDIAGIPYVEIDFDKNGKQQNTETIAPDTTDVFVASHGWNNDKADARALYLELFSNIAAQLSGFEVSGKKFAIVGVFWPSKKFDFKIAAIGGAGGGPAAVATVTESDASSQAAVVARLEEFERYLSMETLPEDSDAAAAIAPKANVGVEVKAAKDLLPKIDTHATARAEFVEHIRSLLDKSAANDEDGSNIFFKLKKGDELMDKLRIDEDDLSEEIINPGGATAVPAGGHSAAPTGGPAGLAEFFKGFATSAINILNFTTYYEMKTRAGAVGKNGVTPLLRELAKTAKNIHLIGHSFGGRVVAAAAAASETDRISSMTLLQAAFSHNGFSKKGFFRSVIEKGRVHGPILVTHTKNDQAVGLAYPLASRLSGDTTAAIGDEHDEFGGIGRNGAQRMEKDELDKAEKLLRDIGGAYAFARRIFNLQADNFIKNHGDVRGKQVAYAALCAVAKRK